MFRFLTAILLASAFGTAAAAEPDGKKVYDSKCVVCHAAGVAGAPKLGDKAAWAPRIKTGKEALVQSVIKGKGAMPPRAGMGATDAEAAAAVDFMIEKAK